MNKNSIWVFLLIYTLLPLFFISLFNLPIGDDFVFGDIARKNTVFDSVSHWYSSWGGRYTQEFLLTVFNPIAYNSLNFFWLPPLVLIVLICFSVWIIISSIANNSLSIKDKLLVFASLLFLIFNLMPEIGETLYWISGAYTFQSGNILFILMVATLFQLTNSKSIYKKIVLFFTTTGFIFLIAGTNEVSMAYQFGFSVLYLIYCFFSKNRSFILASFLFIFVCFASYLSVFAPGNIVRATATGSIVHNVPKAILESILRGSFYLIYWLPSALIVAVLIWKPIGLIASKYSVKTVNLKHFYITLGFFCIVIFAGFLPSLVATGWNPPRSVAPIFIIFLLFFFGILIYFYELINPYIEKITSFNSFQHHVFLIIILVGMSNKHNIMNAYQDIASLKTVKYNKQVRSVYNELATSKKDTIFVMPIVGKPAILPIRWPDHYNHLVNNELQVFFQKKVLMKPNH